MMGSTIEPTMALGRIVRQPIVAESTTMVNDGRRQPDGDPTEPGHQLRIPVDAGRHPGRGEEQEDAEDGGQADRDRDADRDRAAERGVVVVGQVDGDEAGHGGAHAAEGDGLQDAAQGEGLDVDAGQGLTEVVVEHPEQRQHADGVDQRAGEVEAAAARDVDDLAPAGHDGRRAVGGIVQLAHRAAIPIMRALACAGHRGPSPSRAGAPIRVAEEGDGDDDRHAEQERADEDGERPAQEAGHAGHRVPACATSTTGPIAARDRGRVGVALVAVGVRHVALGLGELAVQGGQLVGVLAERGDLLPPAGRPGPGTSAGSPPAGTMAPAAHSRACASSGPRMASSVSGVTSSRSRRKASRLSFAATAASSAAVTAAAACCLLRLAAATSAADSDFPARATRAFEHPAGIGQAAGSVASRPASPSTGGSAAPRSGRRRPSGGRPARRPRPAARSAS